MRIRTLLPPLISILVPLFAAAHKTAGNIQDAQAFAQIQSFCIDTNGLPASAENQVRKFVERENKPRKLLGKLPWKYADQCSTADAVVTLFFSQRTGTSDSVSRGSLQGGPVNALQTTFTKVAIHVQGRSSGKTIYTVEGEESEGDGGNSIGDPFQKLEHDLKDAGAGKH